MENLAWIAVFIGLVTFAGYLYQVGKNHIRQLTMVPGVTNAVIGFCELKDEDVCLAECCECINEFIKPGRSCKWLNQNISMAELEAMKEKYRRAKNGIND